MKDIIISKIDELKKHTDNDDMIEGLDEVKEDIAKLVDEIEDKNKELEELSNKLYR